MKTFVIFSIIFAVTFASSTGDDDARNEDVFFQKGVQSRIAGGQIAKPNQFPYQARIELMKIRNGRLTVSLCGGSLISNKTIMTAAHCLDGATSATINLGTTKVRSTERTRLTLAAFRRDFRMHEKYNSTSMENDIGLISLLVPIRFNDGIRPVSLPPTRLSNLDHAMGIISGFGKTGTNATSSSELRFAYRKILSSKECQKPYPAYYKPQMHVCVDGSDKTSTCPGDSGGPLVISQVDGSKMVVGITSFGGISCDTGYPTVFTRVTRHLSWIHKHTGIPVRD